MKSHAQVFLESSLHLFAYYKTLGEKALLQIYDEKLFWQFNEDSNSAGMIVKHLSGNMLSRWTEFLTTDDLSLKNATLRFLGKPQHCQRKIRFI